MIDDINLPVYLFNPAGEKAVTKPEATLVWGLAQ